MSSIDGLSSGLDTSSIISQLMQIERLPQQRMTTRRLAALTQATTWSQTGTALKALQTAAEGLAKPGSLARTAATSSSPAVGVAATATAAPGSHTLTVTSLAASHTLGSGTLPSSTAPVGAGALLLGRGLAALGVTGFGSAGTDPAASGTYAIAVTAVDAATGTASLTVNGTGYDVDTSSGSVEVAGLRLSFGGLAVGSLSVGTAEITVARTTVDTATAADVASALNAASGIATATLVQVSPGSTRMLLQSDATGTANGLQVAQEGLSALGGFTDVRPASDAHLELDGLSITRSTNTVADLLPGVTLTLQAPVTGASIGVSSDSAASASALRAVVTALNTAIGGLATATAYDAATRKSGSLSGDAGARGLLDTLRSVIGTAAQGAAAPLSAIGLGLQRDGTYAFDEAEFATGLGKDPEKVAALVTTISTALAAAAKAATGGTGAVTTGKDAADTSARALQTAVDAYDTRLALTQARLQKQFSTLERVLGQLRSQGSALSGQIGSLAGFSSD